MTEETRGGEEPGDWKVAFQEWQVAFHEWKETYGKGSGTAAEQAAQMVQYIKDNYDEQDETE